MTTYYEAEPDGGMRPGVRSPYRLSVLRALPPDVTAELLACVSDGSTLELRPEAEWEYCGRAVDTDAEGWLGRLRAVPDLQAALADAPTRRAPWIASSPLSGSRLDTLPTALETASGG